MNAAVSQKRPHVLKQSRAKLWIRTAILIIFGTIFTIALYRDIASEKFNYIWALLSFLPSLVIGFWMRQWVPMQIHIASKLISFSFDKIYFTLILLLVIIKVISERIPELTFWDDVIMCVILGLMIGRLCGICLRVRKLKVLHNFMPQKSEKENV
jgi:peptidoglycan/LPS O-acetylase OafA/YrhL